LSIIKTLMLQNILKKKDIIMSSLRKRKNWIYEKNSQNRDSKF